LRLTGPLFLWINQRMELLGGIVTEVDADTWTCGVRIDGEDGFLIKAVWGGPFMASLLGIKASYMPPKNSRVLVAWSGEDPGIMISGIPHPGPGGNIDSKQAAGGPNFKWAGKDKPLDKDANMHRRGHPPIDLLEGELDLTNLLDTGISLLTGLVRMKAGEAAFVEAGIIDDLVRIVCENYNQTTPFGTMRVVTDGNKPTVIWEGGDDAEDIRGRDKRPKGDRTLDNEEETEDQFKVEMRNKLSMFVGWLGDFVTLFCHDPVDHIKKLTTCHGAMRMTDDGIFNMRVTGEIAFERVVMMEVPVRLRAEEDPQGDSWEEASEDEPEVRWNSTGAPFHEAFQLRHYARWLGNEYLLRRFKKLTKDWKIVREEDQEASTVATRKAYACMRIMRDGSIVHMDGYGSALSLSGGHFIGSGFRSARIESPGEVNIVGNKVNIVGVKGVEVSSPDGGVIISGRWWVKLFCFMGGMLFRTSAQAARPFNPDHGEVGVTRDEEDNITGESVPAEHRIDGIVFSSAGHVSEESMYKSTSAIRRIFTKTIETIDEAGSYIFRPHGAKTARTRISTRGIETEGSVMVDYVVASGSMGHKGNALAGQGPHGNHVSRLSSDYTLADIDDEDEGEEAEFTRPPDMSWGEQSAGTHPESLTSMEFASLFPDVSPFNFSGRLVGQDGTQAWPSEQQLLAFPPSSERLDEPSIVSPVSSPTAPISMGYSHYHH